MSSTRKKRMLQTTRKRRSRGKVYLAVVVTMIIAGIGLYAYVSSLPPGPPDFAIAAPVGVTIQAGHQATARVNVTSVNRFSGTVQLSVTSSNRSLTAGINPSNVTGSGTATLTMMASANGSYTVTVSGKSGSLDHSVVPRVATPIYAILATSDGNMTVELFPASAPQTVKNFVNLAKQGFYTNLTWHRIIPNFVIQTGDPTTINGTGDRNTWGNYQGQSIPFEYDPSLHNSVGYLGMASTGAGVGGSTQFYVNVHDNSASLDGKYAVFGKVISGMNVADTLAITMTTNQYPNAPNQPSNPLAALLLNVTILPS